MPDFLSLFSLSVATLAIAIAVIVIASAGTYTYVRRGRRCPECGVRWSDYSVMDIDNVLFGPPRCPVCKKPYSGHRFHQ